MGFEHYFYNLNIIDLFIFKSLIIKKNISYWNHIKVYIFMKMNIYILKKQNFKDGYIYLKRDIKTDWLYIWDWVDINLYIFYNIYNN